MCSASVLMVFLIETGVATPCGSLDGIRMTAHAEGGKIFDAVVSGCIESATFTHVINHIEFTQQNIYCLGRDSVRNMDRLRSISFNTSKVDVLNPGAFRNVPNLKSIKIAHGNLAKVPRGAFSTVPKLEDLRLNNNKITTIEEDGFAGMTALRRLNCGHNQLTGWNQNWFTDTLNLVVLDFRFNRIRTLPRRAFYSFKKLREVFFDYNELEAVHAEAFHGIASLQYLGLGYNRLRSIDSRVFPNKLVIGHARINANYLNYLPGDMLNKIVVSELTFYGNPWKCPCYNQIVTWLHRLNASAKDSSRCKADAVPVCTFPSENYLTCVETVDEDATKMYLDSLKSIRPPLDKYCARLD